MKKEAKLLLRKAINSLITSIEIFNRPYDNGRVDGVLIFIDHAFEMFLKASIIEKGGKIRVKGAKQTIGYDSCVRAALGDQKVRFLTNEQALSLQTLNSLRDAAQHHFVDISEQHLYIQAQTALTLFKDLYKNVFKKDLKSQLPPRVLPLSTIPPVDLATLFEDEVKEVQKLLQPGKRRQIEAFGKIRSLAILESSIQGEKFQPSDRDLKKFASLIEKGLNWSEVFPGVSSINITSQGYGPSIDLRITKKEGVPVQMVPEGTPGASVIAIKRVDELSFYNLGRDQLAKNVNLTGPKTTAVIRFLKLKEDKESYKEIIVGKARFQRFSLKAIEKIQEALKTSSIEDIWKKHGKKQ